MTTQLTSGLVLISMAIAFPFNFLKAAVVTLPYSTNFDSFATGTSVAPFAETNTANANSSIVDLGGGDKVLRSVITATTSGSSASTSNSVTTSPNLVGQDFSISANITLDSYTPGASSTLNTGLMVLGDNVNLGAGNNYRLFYILSAPTNSMRLFLSELGASGATSLTATTTLISTAQLVPVAGLNFTMTLTGSYSGSELNLFGSLTSGATTLTVSGFDLTPASGGNFGHRTALTANGATVSQTMSFNNFSLVPEPGVSSLLFIAAVGFSVFRRRKSEPI